MMLKQFREKISNGHSQDPTQENVISRYYPGIKKACKLIQETEPEKAPTFQVSLDMPELDEKMNDFFAPAKMQLLDLGNYKSNQIKLLNLMSDPATHTTKTYPSLSMVSRAVNHIKTTGENVIIMVTTSGNKGTALRSAVQRAIEVGLVDKQQLRIMMLAPEASTDKLRKSNLSEKEELRKLNPLILYRCKDGEGGNVKVVGANFLKKYGDEIYQKHNTRIWYSLDLRNYKIPDSARAFFEYEARLLNNQHNTDKKQLHAHAVSSAFGFIGYHLGRTILEKENLVTKEQHPGYFLVQHMDTSDMVLHHLYDSFSRDNMPKYSLDTNTGLYTQQDHPNFPQTSFSANEILDSTFYSKTPFTSDYVSGLIQSFGGGGIIVSLHECLQRYPSVRNLLNGFDGFQLPSDPRRIREWSLVMAFTGVFNAIDRGLISPETEITIHASGCYHTEDFQQLSHLPVYSEGDPVEDLMQYLVFE